MLQSIRDKITGWIAWIFLGAIAVVFVFWGIDFGTGAATYAAKVDGERISIQEVRRAWQQQQSRLQQMMRAELPQELIESQQRAILDQFVRQKLLEQRARDLGFRVSDAALAQRVMEVPDFQVDGQFSKDRYNALLRASGLSEARFEEDLRTETLIRQLQTGIIDSAFVVPYELDRRFAIEKQEREIQYALISANDFLDQITVTDEQIASWYEEHKNEFLLPEKVDLQYVELTRDDAASAIEVTEEALRDYYEQVKDKFETQERRRGRHILITTGSDLDDAAAEKKAADLVAQAKAGADFAQLAKDNSKDPGSAAQGGDLGWAERGMFVGPFEEALFSMSPGEVRGPVKTQFGYHVIKLEHVEAGHARSFDEVYAELEAEYRRQQSESLFYQQTQKLGDLAFESLTELDSVAKALNLPLKTATGFTRETGSAELPPTPEIVEAAFSEDVIERGQNSPLIAAEEDRAMVLRVTQHVPAEARPLAEVRDQVISRIKTQAARDAAAAKGADALARLEKGESWDDVVKALGLNAVGARFVTRQDSVAPAAIVNAAFGVPAEQISNEKPHYAGTVTADGNYGVFGVSAVRDADPAVETPDARASRERLVGLQIGNEEFSAYLEEAVRRADIVKNERVFD
jgi:peptidyl-prolyl cis-trans isomerase D